jgi:hypothetical protein
MIYWGKKKFAVLDYSFEKIYVEVDPRLNSPSKESGKL